MISGYEWCRGANTFKNTIKERTRNTPHFILAVVVNLFMEDWPWNWYFADPKLDTFVVDDNRVYWNDQQMPFEPVLKMQLNKVPPGKRQRTITINCKIYLHWYKAYP